MYRCSTNAIIQVGLFSCFFLFCFVVRLLGFITSSAKLVWGIFRREGCIRLHWWLHSPIKSGFENAGFWTLAIKHLRGKVNKELNCIPDRCMAKCKNNNYNKKKSFKFKAESLIILGNLKFWFESLGSMNYCGPSVVLQFLSCRWGQSCPYLPLLISLFKRKSLHFPVCQVACTWRWGGRSNTCQVYALYFSV